MTAEREQPTARAATAPYTLAELLLYFVRLGTFGLGGPIALVGYMQRDIVEERRWFSKQDYVEGLARAQLAPGPFAAQLAIWFGWLKAGTLGASLVAAAFVLPVILFFIGAKMLLEIVHIEIPVVISFCVIIATLTLAIVFSILVPKKEKEPEAAD